MLQLRKEGYGKEYLEGEIRVLSLGVCISTVMIVQKLPYVPHFSSYFVRL